MEKNGITFSVLIKKDEGLFIAHCLELDIVATAPTIEQLKKDIVSLIRAQLEFAFDNDNLENLFHPAPKEVWQEFYSCKDGETEIQKIENNQRKHINPSIPPYLTTNTCFFPQEAYFD